MKPGIERISGDYDPRYPRALARDEYEAWIAPDQRQRVLMAAAAAASLACAPSARAQQGVLEGTDRIEAVLRVLTAGGAGRSGWFAHASFQRGKDAQGNPTVLPSIPIMFGNSQNGVFDANRARALACELFVAYGLRPVPDHRLVVDDVEATIDVYDPEQRVGIELRGGMPEKQGMDAQPSVESPAAALDDAEHGALAARELRVQCVDLARFPLMDGDQATPTLAYLAGLVEFLNEVAGGPDIDLTSILAKEQGRIALPEAQLDPGVQCTAQGVFQTFQADAAATVTFAIDPSRGYERAVPIDHGWKQPEWRAAEPAPPGGGPVLLELHVQPTAALTVEQDGTPPLRVEAAGALAFLPPRFDPSRPFRVTLRLEPGRSDVQPHLVLYGLPRSAGAEPAPR